jgi:Cu/Ag efflux pump CusA
MTAGATIVSLLPILCGSATGSDVIGRQAVLMVEE